MGGELVCWAEGATRERRELVTDDHHEVVQIVDGERSLEFEDGHPTGRDLAGEARARRRYRSLLADFASAEGGALALATAADADPARVLVVERRDAADERWQLWLDAATLLPIRIRRLTKAADGDHVDEDLLSAHARFGARVLPRHQVTWRDGRRVKDAWLLDYDEEPEIDADAFALGASDPE